MIIAAAGCSSLSVALLSLDSYEHPRINSILILIILIFLILNSLTSFIFTSACSLSTLLLHPISLLFSFSSSPIIILLILLLLLLL